MAKKKARAKAKQAKKKPAKSARKGAARKQPKKRAAASVSAVVEIPVAEEPVAEPSSPDVRAVEANRDRELDEGALATRIATAVLAGLAEQREGNSLSALDSINQRLTAIENRLLGSVQVPAVARTGSQQPTNPAAVVADDLVLNARRQEIWRAELNQQKPLRLPRPTVVGRAMRDLEPERMENPSSFSARRVFQLIRDHGAHHLDKTVADLIDAKGNTASSSRSGLFETRFKRLQGHLLAEVKNDEWILTRHGARVFRGWPDWGVADDDVECEGVLQNVTPPEGPSGASDRATTTNAATSGTTDAAQAPAGVSGGTSGSGGASAGG
jgi:hypothetical protein